MEWPSYMGYDLVRKIPKGAHLELRKNSSSEESFECLLVRGGGHIVKKYTM